MAVRRSLIALAICLATFGPTAAAQLPGTVELGALGRFTIFDNPLGLGDQLGAGGRFGFFIARNIAVEGDASYTETDFFIVGRAAYIPIHARLVWNPPLHPRVALLIGAGYARNEYRMDLNASDNGIAGLLGLRVRLSEVVSLRGEGTLDYVIDAPAGLPGNPDRYYHVGAQLGLSFQFGPRERRDADGDGVHDLNDRCPSTPPGYTVDRSGCPIDQDGDGVADAADRCPGTPLGDAVDGSGCPRDGDLDGVADARDRCPNTAPGTAVNEQGCPMDGDGDAVPDGLDRCPNTAAGVAVGDDGCPPLFEQGRTTVVLEGVTFNTGSAALTESARFILRRVAESLMAHSEVRVEVAGHTDATGARSTNLRLSWARAQSVREFLIAQGVPVEQLEARGYGPDDPIASNASASGRARNRRVELRRLGQ
jgi:OOP family OmpA-OmpF porin